MTNPGLMIAVIADDFTGATDIAGFLVNNGLPTVQLNGEFLSSTQLSHAVEQAINQGNQAVVVSLKSRSIPAAQAVEKSLNVLAVLREFNVKQVYFKYCSTFDSTAQGNIGPVIDALLAELGESMTVVCPALPVNGRTIYNGYLFVDGVPLDESGMRDHPLTPMRDSSLTRLLEAQAQGKAGVVNVDVVDQGAGAVESELGRLRESNVSYAILDAITTSHLSTLGQALKSARLVTGGSGLAGGIAHAMTQGSRSTHEPFGFADGPAVVLSGSSSVMTNQQVEAYQAHAPSYRLDINQIMDNRAAYLDSTLAWYRDHESSTLAPLIYATATPEQVRETQERYGAEKVGGAIEGFFSSLAAELVNSGVKTVITAGGETSGAVTNALDIEAFEVGITIAPGVPLMRSLDGQVYLVLKSGNFGSKEFFFEAQGANADG